MDDLFIGSAKVLNTTTVGAMLIIVLIAFYFTVRTLRGDIKELQAQWKQEREDHQKTRDARFEDLQSIAHLTKSIESLNDKLVEIALGRMRA